MNSRKHQQREWREEEKHTHSCTPQIGSLPCLEVVWPVTMQAALSWTSAETATWTFTLWFRLWVFLFSFFPFSRFSRLWLPFIMKQWFFSPVFFLRRKIQDEYILAPIKWVTFQVTESTQERGARWWFRESRLHRSFHFQKHVVDMVSFTFSTTLLITGWSLGPKK